MSAWVLAGQVAVVTGAAGLLGREHCRALAEAGARVLAADLDAGTCAGLAAELPGDCAGLSVDVTRSASLEAARDEALNRWGRIDILVNNAAVNDKFEDPAPALEQSRFENYPLALWERMFAVNVTGVFLASRVFGAAMCRAGRGSIINIASTYGLVAPDPSLYRSPDGRPVFFKSPAYPSTKGAVLAFTRFLAAYWGPSGVRVNALSPGGVENGQEAFFINAYARRTPLGRMADRADFRGALLFLASEASAYMTGANVVVDGGWTIW
jgi:NAD(P)-dependent dehydrogenase (short-subunit alcohol dehydrogenase family)